MKVGFRLDDGSTVCNQCGELHDDARLALTDVDVRAGEKCSICHFVITWPKLVARAPNKFTKQLIGDPIIIIGEK